jgi:6-phosphogluconolactonase
MTEYPRRDFLALSALGILGVKAFGRVVQRHLESQLLYVGTYTENGRTDGIHLVRMDARSGELRLAGSANAGPNPSFLAIHPNGRVLYAVNEIAAGTLSALAIASDTGALTKFGERPSGGDAPCYVSVDRSGRAALVANYNSGTVALIALAGDGSLGEQSHVERHTGHGPNAERQGGPHAHSIVADPSNRFALSADLGIDRVLVYRLDLANVTLEHVTTGDAVLRPGAGPRHLAFHPTLPLLFVSDELDSTVTTLHIDGGNLRPVATVSTLPKGWTGENYPADIHVDSSGTSLYVSNRGHNSIAVFSIAPRTGALTLEQVIGTEGDWPRNFTLDPTERWLIVANQRSGNIVVFGRDPGNGRLTSARQQLAIPSPVCLRFPPRSA